MKYPKAIFSEAFQRSGTFLHVSDTVGEILLNPGNPCATVESPRPEFPKNALFRHSVSGAEPGSSSIRLVPAFVNNDNKFLKIPLFAST